MRKRPFKKYLKHLTRKEKVVGGENLLKGTPYNLYITRPPREVKKISGIQVISTLSIVFNELHYKKEVWYELQKMAGSLYMFNMHNNQSER